MIRRRCLRLVVPADMHLPPVARDHAHAGDLLIADWKLRGAWRRPMTEDQAPPHGVPTAGAA